MIEPITSDRHCARCQQIKSESEFSLVRRKGRATIRHSYCKGCRCAQAKDRASLGRRKDRKHREEIWPRKLGEALLDVTARRWRYSVAPVALRWTA